MFKVNDRVIIIDTSGYNELEKLRGKSLTVKYTKISLLTGKQHILVKEFHATLMSSRFILEEPVIKPQTELEWIQWFSSERTI